MITLTLTEYQVICLSNSLAKSERRNQWNDELQAIYDKLMDEVDRYTITRLTKRCQCHNICKNRCIA